ncbi:hypothetical protein, partial [Pusillimonas minor]|uniref:hypothetical protein n=1 Tax=Pusillimonas minor TaxID=2697024 RepID=UPI001C8E32F3
GTREAENSLIKINVHLPKLMDTYSDETPTRALDGTGRTLTKQLMTESDLPPCPALTIVQATCNSLDFSASQVKDGLRIII